MALGRIFARIYSLWSDRLTVRTSGSHPDNSGSIPDRITKNFYSGQLAVEVYFHKTAKIYNARKEWVGFFIRLLNHKSPKVGDILEAPADRRDLADAIIREISEGVAVIDAKGLITLFNPAAESLTGWTANDASDLDYRTVFKLFDKTEHPLADGANPIMIARHSGAPAEDDDCYLTTKSGHNLLVSLTVTPLFQKFRDPSTKEEISRVDNLVITFRDVTSERADQNQQTEFISTASHEMRTPVAIIEGYIGMLLNPATATVDARGLDYAHKAHEAAQHLGRLFQDLLDVTKADDRRTLTDLVLVNAGDAAKQVVQEFQRMAAQKSLSLTFAQSQTGSSEKVIAPLYVIYVDYDQLKEILGNLEENALKYTKRGGVTVGVRETAGRVRFEVHDTGIGVPPEDLSHLFQKFYRVDNSDTREIGGTGLGLYLIKKLAENMGGQVGAESTLGKGSTFWVEFANLSREQMIEKAQIIKQRQKEQK